MTKRLLIAVPVLAAMAVLTACGGGGSSSDPAALQDKTYSATAMTVDGTEQPLAEGSTLTVSFNADGISVNAGCNTMFGGADLSNGKITVTGALAGTKMACSEALMAQDDQIAQFLSATPSWTLEGDQLKISNDTTSVTLSPAAAQ